jgi:heme/copper-type cytochrome/quinol oxidase subunit 2
MKIWWTANIVWLVLFVMGTFFISLRKVDGTGAVQTPEAQLISLVVLGIAFIIVLLIQLIWGFLVQKLFTEDR